MFDTKLPFRPLFNSKDVGSEASAEVEDQRRNKLFEEERKEKEREVIKEWKERKRKRVSCEQKRAQRLFYDVANKKEKGRATKNI